MSACFTFVPTKQNRKKLKITTKKKKKKKNGWYKSDSMEWFSLSFFLTDAVIVAENPEV